MAQLQAETIIELVSLVDRLRTLTQTYPALGSVAQELLKLKGPLPRLKRDTPVLRSPVTRIVRQPKRRLSKAQRSALSKAAKLRWKKAKKAGKNTIGAAD